MIERGRKGRLNKRELLETEKYTKHQKAQPYKRKKVGQVVVENDLTEEDKLELLGDMLGDWDANGV